MFGNKDDEKAVSSAAGEVGSLVERLGALPSLELAHEVITLMVEIGPNYYGLLSHNVMVSNLAFGNGRKVLMTLSKDAQARRLHILLAEGLQILQNAGLVCMFDTNEFTGNVYTLTRLGEDAVARSSVPEILSKRGY